MEILSFVGSCGRNQGPDDQQFEEVPASLQNVPHVEQEEDELFPELRESVSEQDLNELASGLAR